MSFHGLVLRIIITTLLLLLFSPKYSASFTDDDNKNPPYHDCPATSFSYTSNSKFEANLNDTLFTEIPDNAFRPYSNFTNGTGIDAVYALYYCRGDANAYECNQCLEAAVQEIVQKCQFKKQGIVWYELCTLRYANYTMFSLAEDSPSARYYNHTSLVSKPVLQPYEELFNTTMNDVIYKAAYKGNPSGFAVIENNLSESRKIRGLAQCSPFIGGTLCENCLRSTLLMMDRWSNTIVFLPNCQIRYDLYGAAPPTKDDGHHSVIKIVIGVLVPVIVIALVVGLCVYWFWWQPRQKSGQKKKKTSGFPGVVTPPEIPNLQLARFSYCELKDMTNEFARELGRGGYAIVYYGRLLSDASREVAVKVFSAKDGPNQFSNEVHMVGIISHRNLVSLIGYCEEGTKLALVYEYMPGGDLKAHLSEHLRSALNWKTRLGIACDTAQGLEYLHTGCSEIIIHRDVKPANILLNQHNQAKVADFGISKIFPAEYISKLDSTRVLGTIGYVDPQYNLTGQVNEKSDVYSFGVVLLELITGKTAIISNTGTNLVKWVTSIYKRGDIASILDPRLRLEVGDNYNTVWRATELANKCVESNGALRPTMTEIVTELRECLRMENNAYAASCSTGITTAANSITLIRPQAR